MNVNEIKEIHDRIDEVSVIGISTEYEGWFCHVVGLMREGCTMSLVLLQYQLNPDKFKSSKNVKISDSEEQPKENTNQKADTLPQNSSKIYDTAQLLFTTNRAELKNHINRDMGSPLSTMSHITIEDTVYQVESSISGPLHTQDWETIFVLYEFLRQGWNPDDMAFQKSEQLNVTGIQFAEKFTSLPQFLKPPKLKFRLSFPYRHFLIEQPFTLFIGDGPTEKQYVTNTTQAPIPWFYITRVQLFDPWKNIAELYSNPRILEHMTQEEALKNRLEMEDLLADECPRGMCYPMVEYECEENVSLQFYLKEFLEAEPVHRNRASTFFFVPEKKPGIHGFRLKHSLIQTPVSTDCIRLEAELFECQQLLEDFEISIG